MPYYHCTKCHHEFESYPEKTGVEVTDPKCDWCGEPSYLLEEKTPLEQMSDEIENMGMEKFLERLGMIEKELEKEIENVDK
jgi:uncharacterized CHY-type Zn-finger protein